MLNKRTIQVPAGDSGIPATWDATTLLGTLNGGVTSGSTGTCDNATVSGTHAGSSTVEITNVQGEATCFDIASIATQGGLAWSGRGSISTDGKTFSLEGYLTAQNPTGDTCADGEVGAHTVTINGTPFTRNAVQVYRIQ